KYSLKLAKVKNEKWQAATTLTNDRFLIRTNKKYPRLTSVDLKTVSLPLFCCKVPLSEILRAHFFVLCYHFFTSPTPSLRLETFSCWASGFLTMPINIFFS